MKALWNAQPAEQRCSGSFVNWLKCSLYHATASKQERHDKRAYIFLHGGAFADSPAQACFSPLALYTLGIHPWISLQPSTRGQINALRFSQVCESGETLVLLSGKAPFTNL